MLFRKPRKTLIQSIVLIAGLWLAVGAGAQNIPFSGQAIVRTTNASGLASYFADIDGALVDSVPAEGIFLGSFPTTIPVEIVLEQLLNIPAVLSAQANYRIGLPEIDQISQSFPDQSPETFVCGVSPESYYQQSAVYAIGMESAGLVASGSDVLIAVIDNGIDFSHPLLEGRISLGGFDFLDGDNDPSEETGAQYGHGTFVSGLVCLVAPESHILPIRCFGSDGYGSTYAVIKGIYWAVDQGAQVINMSFSTQDSCPVLESAVADAVQAGLIPVASVGNDGSAGEFYPAAYPGVTAVAAIYTTEEVADFSNYGDFVDLCAPGVDVYSALTGTHEWGNWSGTSFSAPLVSGTVALLFDHKPDWAATEVEEHLRASSRKDLLWGTVVAPDPYYGYGCLDVFGALKQLAFGDGSALTLPGFEVMVSLDSEVTITFDEVQEAGYTVLNLSAELASGCQTHSLLPNQSPVIYDITTSAIVSGSATVGIAYDGTDIVEDESGISLLQYDNSQWINITTEVDSTTMTVYGSASSLSSFAVGQPCCTGLVGDCDLSGTVDITDISVLVDNQFHTLTPLVCEEAASINYPGTGYSTTDTLVDITDLTILIDNQFLSLAPLPPCP